MALREGWLHKEGGSFKTWKKRWFVIEGDEFAYYNKKGGKSPLSFIFRGLPCASPDL